MKDKLLLFFIALALIPLAGCEKLINVENPVSKVSRDLLFNDEVTATSAVTGMYAEMIENNRFSSGGAFSITLLTSLTADDITTIDPLYDINRQYFADNDIPTQSGLVQSVWQTAYQVIYQANSIIESLTASTGLSAAAKDQLQGEALFVRAFAHFTLVNTYGDVPLITTTDYKVNTMAPRKSVDDVYAQILQDLLSAQTLMSDNYPSAERVRPNKAVATALLARVYLYREDWANAEAQSTLLINDERYQLEYDLGNTFLATSHEAIWQLMPTVTFYNTWEGSLFHPYPGSIPSFKLMDGLLNSFETNDARLTKWVGKIESDNGTFYYPDKYKINYGGPTSTPPIPLSEYSMVFRFAEQFLIRAEARAQQDRLQDAIADVDTIRNRAGLPLIGTNNPAISKANLLLAIEEERFHELFTEWGHRWYDLARTGRATAVLGPQKTDWQATDVLFPIPALEFDRNYNLGDQNPGY